MSKKPKISVLVPIKDGEQYITRKIKELREIDYRNLEIIISVNKSSDRSVEIVQEACLNLQNYKLFIQKTTLEIAEHFSFLLNEAEGSLIAFSAVDDSLSPDFLNEAEELLQRNSELVAVSALAYYEKNSHGARAIQLNLMGDRKERLLEFRKNARVSHSLFYCLTSKSILMEFAKKYPKEFIGRDWIFNIVLLKKGKVATTSRAYIVFGEQGLSRQKDTFQLQTGKKKPPVFPFRYLISSIFGIAFKEIGELTIPLITFAMDLSKKDIKRGVKLSLANSQRSTTA